MGLGKFDEPPIQSTAKSLSLSSNVLDTLRCRREKYLQTWGIQDQNESDANIGKFGVCVKGILQL